MPQRMAVCSIILCTYLVEVLSSQVEMLRVELDEAHAADRENRRIIADLVERIPPAIGAPEASPESRESPESEASPGPSETPTDAPEGPQEARERPFTEEEPQPRPWWRRVFGG
jgi:hypothetical protein